MGREIRRVPADWEHPKYTESNTADRRHIGSYIPMHDEDYHTAAQKWMADLDLWRQGKHEDQGKKYAEGYEYMWDYAGMPPDRQSYRARKWTPEEATHYQVYENVTEGTPITPPLPSKEALIEYLVTQGDFWRGKWQRDSAELFVKNEYAPSMIVTIGPQGARIDSPETQT